MNSSQQLQEFQKIQQQQQQQRLRQQEILQQQQQQHSQQNNDNQHHHPSSVVGRTSVTLPSLSRGDGGVVVSSSQQQQQSGGTMEEQRRLILSSSSQRPPPFAGGDSMMNPNALYLLQQQQQQQMNGPTTGSRGRVEPAAVMSPLSSGSQQQQSIYWNAAMQAQMEQERMMMMMMQQQPQPLRHATAGLLPPSSSSAAPSSSSLFMGAGGGQLLAADAAGPPPPRMAAGVTSAPLLLQQERIMANLKRQLERQQQQQQEQQLPQSQRQQQQQQGSTRAGQQTAGSFGGVAVGSSPASASRMTTTADTTAAASPSASQRQAMFQQQQQQQPQLRREENATAMMSSSVGGVGGGMSSSILPAALQHNGTPLRQRRHHDRRHPSLINHGAAMIPPPPQQQQHDNSNRKLPSSQHMTMMETTAGSGYNNPFIMSAAAAAQQRMTSPSGSRASSMSSSSGSHHVFAAAAAAGGGGGGGAIRTSGDFHSQQQSQPPHGAAMAAASGSVVMPFGHQQTHGMGTGTIALHHDVSNVRRSSNTTINDDDDGGGGKLPPGGIMMNPSSTGADGGQQQFMEGTFHGGWQSNVDLPDRRGVILTIMNFISQTRHDDDEETNQKLPYMARRLEEHLYRTAPTKKEYLDMRTLKSRLQSFAFSLCADLGSSPVSRQREARRLETKTRAEVAEIQQAQKTQIQGLSPHRGSLLLQSQQHPELGVAVGSVGHHRDDSTALVSRAAPSVLAQDRADILQEASEAKRIGSPSAVAQDKGELNKRMQKRLLLLRHASKCKLGASCKIKVCGQMVALWKHMKKCRDKDCKTAHCLSSRFVLNHYRTCKSEHKISTCEICGPVMQRIKEMEMTQQESTGKDGRAMPKDDSLADTASMANRRQFEELAATQQSHQQELLLNQLKQQQAHLAEQQQQLQKQQEKVEPQTEEGIQLQQQQGLLEQLQRLYQQQELVLLQEIATNSLLNEESNVRTSERPLEAAPEEATPGFEKRSRRTQRQLGQSRGKSPSTMERLSWVASVQAPHGSVPRKRPSDLVESEPTSEIDDIEGARSKKVSKLETPDLRPKVLHQGVAEHTTSLIQSMSVDAIEQHLASLNGKIHITPQTVKRRCLPVVRRLIKDKFGWVFRDPVDAVELGLPDYFEIVKNPMNLCLVESKLLNDEYPDLDAFASDVRLVFDNAILYNGEDSEVGEMATIMLRHFEKDYKAVLKGFPNDQGSFDRKHDTCNLCGSQRRLFEPKTLYCNGVCGKQRIRRNAIYYTEPSKLNNWCASCFADLDGEELIHLEDGSEISKSSLQRFKNDGMPEEAWVQCDECNGWVHQICALFNGRRNKNAAVYRCPKCYVEKVRHGEVSETGKRVKGAKDLPHCKMSAAIEDGLQKALSKAYEDTAVERGVDVSQVKKAEGLSVRVVSNMEKKHVVRDEILNRYGDKRASSEFPVRSKCIALFQTIDGVDVLLFAMYVYEYDDSCPPPNRRRVYISYLDSVYYFQPKKYRTTAYHALIIEYLRYVKGRGFHTAHIWSCPPSDGDEYVFHCHPKEQLIPREYTLRQWYSQMLKKAEEQGVVVETVNLYDEYFNNNGMDAPKGSAIDPTCLPYFEGDYLPWMKSGPVLILDVQKMTPSRSARLLTQTNLKKLRCLSLASSF